MKDIYKEICEHCPLKGNVSKPIKIFGVEITYIDCQRDNDDAKERFLHTLKEEDALMWARKEVQLLHCIYII